FYSVQIELSFMLLNVIKFRVTKGSYEVHDCHLKDLLFDMPNIESLVLVDGLADIVLFQNIFQHLIQYSPNIICYI
ncbi:hypothetical protein IFM89_005441, partial [Coptis chinensis]